MTSGLPGVSLGPDSPLLAAKGAATAALRRTAGLEFEAELERQHAIYLRQGKASIRKNNPRVAGPPGRLHYAKGGAPCDFAGAAVIDNHARPVLFDAKGVGRQASYQHPPEQIHQVQELLEHQRVGGLSFLLLRDAELRIAYIVNGRDYLTALSGGESIPLRSGRGSAVRHHHPCVNQDRFGLWDWLLRLSTALGCGEAR